MSRSQLACAGALAIAALFVGRIYGQGVIECVTGDCYTEWTAQIWSSNEELPCQVFWPYECVGGDGYMFDIDEAPGQGCIATSPQENYTAWACPEGYCDPVCNNCPASKLCLQAGTTPNTECEEVPGNPHWRHECPPPDDE